MKTKAKSFNSDGPFHVLQDGTRYYIPVPENLQPLIGQTKFTSSVEAEMEIEAQRLNAQYARHLTVVTKPRSVLDLFDRIKAAGYSGNSLIDFLLEEAVAWEARKKEPDLEALRKLYIADCLKRKKHSMIVNISRLQLPWPNKKISEFAEHTKADEFISEIETFLDSQINFYHGRPWSKGMRNRWLCDFLAIINFAVKKRKTPVQRNPLEGAFDLSKPKDVGPEIFEMAELQLFLTYIRHWYPDLYIPFVLATWGCIRLTEVSRMTRGMIHLGDSIKKDGRIDLTSSITKKEDNRKIFETHVPHLFELLRSAEHLLCVDEKNLIVAVPNWSAKVEGIFRELFGRHRPSNASRATGASALYFRNKDIVPSVMGHSAKRIDETLLKHYLDSMTQSKVEAFESMVPSELTAEVRATILYKMADIRCDITASTEIWNNYRMQYMPRVNMRHPFNEKFLRRKRPIFATAHGAKLVVEILHRDGREEIKTFSCASASEALILEQKWRIVTLTGLGQLNLETGEVYGYELNYGPCYHQKLYQLERPRQLEELMRRDGKCVVEVAAAIGCATDFVCRYAAFTTRKTPFSPIGKATEIEPEASDCIQRRHFIPERFVVKLRGMFPELAFTLATKVPSELAWISRGCLRTPQQEANHLRRQNLRAARLAKLPKSSQEKKRSTVSLAGHLP